MLGKLDFSAAIASICPSTLCTLLLRILGTRRPRVAREGSPYRRPETKPLSWSNGGRELGDTQAAKEVDEWFRN